MSICKWCGQEIEKNMASYHSRICDKNPKSDYNKQVLKNNAINTNKKLKELGYEQYIKDEHKKKIHYIKCKKCNKEYMVFCSDYLFYKGKYKHYCSRECANSRVMTDTIKEKIANTLLNKIYKNNINKNENNKNNYIIQNNIQNNIIRKKYICKVCGKEYKHQLNKNTRAFCSFECQQKYKQNKKLYMSPESLQALSNAGKKSAYIQREVRRSKNEILFYELCKKEFNNVLHNEPIFNGWDADIILSDYKIAVLWNGKWHYEQIMEGTSLIQIQNRDNIKIKEIKEKQYIPYIIKDLNKYSENFVKEQFNIFKQYINNIKNN